VVNASLLAKGVEQFGDPKPVHVQNGEAVKGELTWPFDQCVRSQPDDAGILDAVGFRVASKKDVHAVIHDGNVHEVAVAVGDEVVAIFVGSGGLGFSQEMFAVGRKLRAHDVPLKEGINFRPNAQKMRKRVFFSLTPNGVCGEVHQNGEGKSSQEGFDHQGLDWMHRTEKPMVLKKE